MKRKILLVQAPNDRDHQGLNSGYRTPSPSLALIALRATIMQFASDWEVKILDGNFMNMNEMIKIITERGNDFDFVGFSDLFYNTENNQNLAKLIRKLFPQIQLIWGNVNVSVMGSRYLKKGIADYIVKGAGEGSILKILSGKTKRGEIIKTKWSINNLPVFNFEGYDLSAFNARQSSYVLDDQTLPFPISITRDCYNSHLRGRCSFCVKFYDKMLLMNADNAWKCINFLFQKYGVKYFLETGDDFVYGKIPSNLLNSRPSHLQDTCFRFYSNLDGIDKKQITVLKELNTKVLFIGLENIDPEILSLANKLYSSIDLNKGFDEIFKKYDLVEEAGIDFYLPILFGLEGENRRAIEKNVSFVEEMMKRYSKGYLTKFYCGIVVPNAGTSLFLKLLNNQKLREEYAKHHNEIYQEKTIDY